MKINYLSIGAALAFALFNPFAALGQTYTWSTIAGLPGVNGTNDGTGSSALFFTPSGIATDGTGANLYVADYGNDLIRQVSFNSSGSNWSVVTIAGKPLPYSGDDYDLDGTGNLAQLYAPAGIVYGNSSLLYVVDDGPRLRIMTLSSGAWKVTSPTVPGNNIARTEFGNPTALAMDGSGSLYVTASADNKIDMLTLKGQNWANVSIAGDQTNQTSGSADGTNWFSRFNYPDGVGTDTSGNVYVADTANNTIRKITPVLNSTNWITTTIAGQAGSTGYLDGTNRSTLFNGPDGVAVDGAGNVYIADANNNLIRKLTPQGTNWVVTTIGGQLNRSHGTNDGVGYAASFYHPAGLAVDSQGRVFVADYQNNTIRMGVPSGATNQPPSLQIATVGNAAYVIWPSSATGYVLQTSTNGSGGPWQNVTTGITTNFVFSKTMSNGRGFYRLQQ